MKKLIRAVSLAFLFSAFLTILVVVFFFPLAGGEEQRLSIALLIVFFVLSFLLSWFLIDKIIYWRVYMAIHHHRLKQDAYKEKKINLMSDGAKQVEEELAGWSEDRRNEIERLRKLELYRKEYIGNVSHELKTPVFNIQGYVLTLLDGALDDPKVNRDYLVRAEKSVERMINMIDDLEAISQLETGELVIEPEKFDIIALVKDVFNAQELMATHKGIMFGLKENSSRTLPVVADRSRIRQVLTNLIVNSVKYGKEYGHTTVAFYDSGDTITVEVTDDGIGIAPEHLPRLFERFYRVDKSRSREQGGTGLGLSIVKHIIEAHEQTIHVSSRQGEGSVFSFTLKKG